MELIDDVALAEAAAWLGRMRQPERSAGLEEGFRAWLADEGHARAFAQVTETWELLPGAVASSPARERQPRRLAAGLAIAACVLAGIGLSLSWTAKRPVYRTAIGEQRVLTLDDGSRVALNTGSEVMVDYGRLRRRVVLRRGEAMFEVAKNPNRPFIAQAGSEEVRALGTIFVVRQEATETAVTLVSGRVEVTQAGAGGVKRLAILDPQERLTIGPAGSMIDRPSLETVTAWRRGLLVLDNATLLEAASEFNRYNRRPLQVADPDLAGLKVSGVFNTADPAGFARSVALLHDARVTDTGALVRLDRQ
ncbi:FecR family protein [Phenylobacterium immobile]|uniref:FecR family protein n=1 Tax=Phenylobacterium immobile TaxID=21 RepID=UPI00159ECDA6|nr:FecR domain-containing protein [Phenylobacterium immobile]